MNDDGFMDLVALYRTAPAGLEAEHAEACLTGFLRSALRFEGCDAIAIVPPARSRAPIGRGLR